MSNKQNTNTNKPAKKTARKRPNGQAKSPAGKAVSVPVSKVHIAISRPAKSMVIKDGGFRVIKSEMVGTIPIASNDTWDVKYRLRINPASTTTFKTLPNIARNFESFRFRKLHFRYENRCASTDRGSVVISPNYDAADSDAQAASEAVLYENKGTKDFSIWKNETLVMNVAAMNRLYKKHTCCTDLRFANTKQDVKTLDPAQVFVALDSVVLNQSPGKLFVDYDVEFFDPHAPTEDVQSGGAVMDFAVDSANTFSNSTKPFTASSIAGGVAGLTRLNELIPVLDPKYGLDTTSGSGANTAAFAKFARDWSGIINMVANGTGLINNQLLYVGDDPLTDAGTGTDLLAPITDNIQDTASGGLKNIFSHRISAKEGQYLKWKSPTFTTLTNFRSQLGGSSVF